MTVLDLEGAALVARAWREQGFRVGFANGCFDILHAGHVALLEHAARECDRLMVALNSDASVTRLKGSTRPINNLADRAKVIGALRCVDAVATFGTDTPVDLIEAVRPILLVKGSEYNADEIVGGDLVRSWGGTVLLADMSPGRSTTSIIQRAKGS